MLELPAAATVEEPEEEGGRALFVKLGSAVLAINRQVVIRNTDAIAGDHLRGPRIRPLALAGEKILA